MDGINMGDVKYFDQVCTHPGCGQTRGGHLASSLIDHSFQEPLLSSNVFSPEEVASLNAYQTSGVFHPFTCGGDRTDENHLDGQGLLVATRNGWICIWCDYKQSWAHEWMRDGTWMIMKQSFIDIMHLGDKNASN